MNKPIAVKSVLMLPGETMCLSRAANHARRNEKTVRRWAVFHGIGRKSGKTSPWDISRPGLDMVLQGDFEALEKLRAGDRSDPDVIRYFDLAGLPAG